jgi:hypothetical protein
MTKPTKKNSKKSVFIDSNSSIVTENDNSETTENQKEGNNTRSEIKNINPQRTMNWLTLALVFFTAVQVLVNYLMWDQISKQTPAIINATKLANQNFKSAQRAFIKIGDPIETIKFAAVRMPIENYGNTACDDIFIDATFREIRAGEEYKRQMPPSHTDSSHFSIHPKEIKHIGFFLPHLSKSEIDSIKKNLITIYIIGYITYNTGFNDIDGVDINIIYNWATKRWEQIGILNIIDFKEIKHEQTQTNK